MPGNTIEALAWRAASSRSSLRRAIAERCAAARWPLPAAIIVGLASLGLLLVQAETLLSALYRNADNAVTLLLPSSDPTGSITLLGNHPWYEAWWFMRATVGLPDHLLLWKAAPFIVAFLGIGAIGWCANAVAGRVGAVICVVALVSMSEPLRAVMLVPEARVGLPLHAAVLCGALLVIDRLAFAGRMTRRRWIAGGILLVAFTAAGTTDQLLLPAAVAPYVAATFSCWWRDRSAHSRRLAEFALLTAVASIGGSILVTHIMSRSGVAPAYFPLRRLAALTAVRGGIGRTLSLFATLTGGGLSLRTLAGPLALAALIGTCAKVCLAATRLRPAAMSKQQRATTLYVAFWACALILSLGALALTNAGGPTAAHDAAQRYLIGAWVAVAALLAVGARRPAFANALLVGVVAFGLLNLQSDLFSVRQPWEYGLDSTQGSALDQFALAHRATTGYGGYWDVMPLGLQSGGRVSVVPITEAGGSGVWRGAPTAANSSWFRQRPGNPASFLVTDSRGDVPMAAVAPPTSFGRPTAERRFGPLTVYIYPHDLARYLLGAS